MALDISTTAIIRGGSGVLFVAVGLLILASARRERSAQMLAAAAISFGIGFIVINFIPSPSESVGLYARGITTLAAAGFLLAFSAYAPWRSRVARRDIILAASIAVAAGVAGEALTWPPSVLRITLTGNYQDPFASQLANVGQTAFFAAAVFGSLTAAFGAKREGKARAAGLLAVTLLTYDTYTAIGLLDNLATQNLELFRVGPYFAGILAVVIAWLPRERFVSWALLGLGLASMTVNAVVPGFLGDVGIARCIAAVLLALAVLRYDLLETPLPGLVLQRGTLAMGGLALLFIVAQVAQNFFSATYGLLTGGIVAGAFLFAASPIQRAMERLSDRSPTGEARDSPVLPSDDIARRESLYLNAVRLALRDRRLTRAEEAHLHALAEELGLGAKRAHELLVQAEREAGVA